MTADALNAKIDDAIRQCDGDVRGAVGVALLMAEYWEEQAARLAEALSPGYLGANMVECDAEHKAG